MCFHFRLAQQIHIRPNSFLLLETP